MIYAPVKTAYPESKDLARFHRPRPQLLSVSKQFLKLHELEIRNRDRALV